jgi:hypothetical protein
LGAVGVHDENPLAAVRAGMRVVDTRGNPVGVVEQVRMGDPQAVTSQGQAPAAYSSLLDRATSLFTGAEPDVPEELADRLLRLGYLKIDGPTLLERDRYVAADRVAGVEEETVTLSIPEETTVLEQ